MYRLPNNKKRLNYHQDNSWNFIILTFWKVAITFSSCIIFSKIFKIYFNFFNPHPRAFFIASREKRRMRRREIETSMQERSINWLPPVCTQTRDQTRKFSVMGQHQASHTSQGCIIFWLIQMDTLQNILQKQLAADELDMVLFECLRNAFMLVHPWLLPLLTDGLWCLCRWYLSSQAACFRKCLLASFLAG